VFRVVPAAHPVSALHADRAATYRARSAVLLGPWLKEFELFREIDLPVVRVT
jgi:hypothetical protein